MVADAAGLTAFVAAGTVSHGGSGLLGSAAVTLASLLGCWFALAVLLGAYRMAADRVRVVAVWALAVPLAVLARALLLGRTLDGHEAAFLVTSLVFTALFVVAARVVTSHLGTSGPGPENRGQAPDRPGT